VPTLILDDGTIIDGSQNIIAWAKQNSATARERTAGTSAT
jgi:hypothetical protein